MRTPDYTELDRLFARWQRRYPFTAFIRDGIVDPACYDFPHILFILRDKTKIPPAISAMTCANMAAVGRHGTTSGAGRQRCWTAKQNIRGICPVQKG